MVFAKRRLPYWCKRSLPRDPSKVIDTDNTVSMYGLRTVCDHAICPNRLECYSRGTATFLVLGSICTRGCRFCAISAGVPEPVDTQEPLRVANAIKDLGLNYVVITSVTRDDLSDGGAQHFATTINAIRAKAPQCRVETLVPDFKGDQLALETVLSAAPDVLSHNLETVPRLYPTVRAGARYERSLELLRLAAFYEEKFMIKSGLMLGLGEEADEVEQVLRDLKTCGCRSIVIGQYLQPSREHLSVSRYVEPSEFEMWKEYAETEVGFEHVVAGPLVRSSYRAGAIFERNGD